MSEERVSLDLRGVEATLSSLTPKPPGVNRDRLMYRVGRASCQPRGGRRSLAKWLWPVATAASLLLAVTFATMWLGREELRIVCVQRPSQPLEELPQPAESSPRVAESIPKQKQRADYLKLRRLVTTQGVGALPESGSAPVDHIETLRWGSGFDRTLAELLDG